jgi:ribosomal-protein-alanine N-acetyltransferase
MLRRLRPGAMTISKELSKRRPPASEESAGDGSPRRRADRPGLMQTVFAWARDLGAEEVWLEVRESNMRALRLYQQCGFTVVGRRPGYYADPPEDAVRMHGRIEHGCGDAPV